MWEGESAERGKRLKVSARGKKVVGLGSRQRGKKRSGGGRERRFGDGGEQRHFGETTIRWRALAFTPSTWGALGGGRE